MLIERYRGDTKRIRRQVVDKDLGTPIDVTWNSFKLTVSATDCPEDTTDQIFAIDATVEGGADGLIHFLITQAIADTPVGTYYYDIAWTDANNEVETLEKGSITFSQDIGK